MPSMMTTDIVTQIQKDDRYKSLFQIMKNSPMFKSIKVEELKEEVSYLHTIRPIRTLVLSKIADIDEVIEANLVEQSTRSRLVEICKISGSASRNLTFSTEKLRDYVTVKYWGEVSKLKTKDERFIVVNIALAPIYSVIKNMDNLYEESQLIIEDIDKASFSLQRLVTLLQYKYDKREVKL